MRTDVVTIVRNFNYKIKDVQMVKDYLFMTEQVIFDFELQREVKRLLYPSFDIAQSWQRLLLNGGKDAKPHDLLLIPHELLEIKYVKSGLNQSDAHIKACEKYNYQKAANRYYRTLKNRRKKNDTYTKN